MEARVRMAILWGQAPGVIWAAVFGGLFEENFGPDSGSTTGELAKSSQLAMPTCRARTLACIAASHGFAQCASLRTARSALARHVRGAKSAKSCCAAAGRPADWRWGKLVG